jgi:hypothetical protein
VLADLHEVAAALQIAGPDSETDEPSRGRPLRGIRRELLQAMRVLAPFAAAEDGPGGEMPRMRHLRAASLLPFPMPGALALDCLLEVLLRRRSPSDSRVDLARADTLRGAAEDLRAAAAVLHRLDPRPAGRMIAQLAALAVDLHRIAGGPGA